jgi:hypothetical protein
VNGLRQEFLPGAGRALDQDGQEPLALVLADAARAGDVAGLRELEERREVRCVDPGKRRIISASLPLGEPALALLDVYRVVSERDDAVLSEPARGELGARSDRLPRCGGFDPRAVVALAAGEAEQVGQVGRRGRRPGPDRRPEVAPDVEHDLAVERRLGSRSSMRIIGAGAPGRGS